MRVHVPVDAPVTRLLTITELPLLLARVIVTDRELVALPPEEDPLSGFFTASLGAESPGDDGV